MDHKFRGKIHYLFLVKISTKNNVRSNILSLLLVKLINIKINTFKAYKRKNSRIDSYFQKLKLIIYKKFHLHKVKLL